MKIVQAPNEVLSTVARPVEKIDKSIHELLDLMRATLLSAHDPEGVGLAAPQIGKSLQIFIVKESLEADITTYINPVIEKFFDAPTPRIKPQKESKEPSVRQAQDKKAKSKKPKEGVQLEGCLSLQDIWGVVKRRDGVILSYQDEKGVKHTKSFDGFMSVIMQHEYDHLQGVLFPKRVLEQESKLYKSKKDKKGETEFEEMEI